MMNIVIGIFRFVEFESIKYAGVVTVHNTIFIS